MDILVPCKGLMTGKSRLRACLDSDARRDLCEHLLVNTLRAAARLAGPDRVHVVTADEEAASIARRHCVRQIGDPGYGLNEALEFARSMLLSEGRSDILVLPIDLPYLDAKALSNVMACKGDVVIASDERGTGTNILHLRAAAVRDFPFAYGAGSYTIHLAAARAMEVPTQVIRDWRLSFDIDEPAQYFQWREDCEPVAGIMMPDPGFVKNRVALTRDARQKAEHHHSGRRRKSLTRSISE